MLDNRPKRSASSSLRRLPSRDRSASAWRAFWRIGFSRLAVFLVALALTPRAALADPPPRPSATPARDPDADMAADSPRASLKHYLALCREGEYAEAADYLDLSEAQKPNGATLARHLKAVLDRQIWVRLDAISPLSLGNDGDKLPPGVEEIGSIPTAGGPEPVRLVRRYLPEGPRWVFSRGTADKIEDWYSHLRDHWIQEYMPERLLRQGPHDLMWWQLITLPAVLIATWIAGKLFGFVVHRLAARVMKRRPRAVTALRRMGAPSNFLLALSAVYVLIPYVELYPPAEAFVERILRAGALVALFWFVFRFIDIGEDRLLEMPTAKQNAAARSLVPLITKGSKIAVFAMALVAAFSELGYPVASLVAGLGIGGVALALAAQKTVENLFGSVSIGVDQPFRLGDVVRVEDVNGTVESIGLRSTRIRTFARTLVTIPNGKLADLRIESMSARDRIRLALTIGLSHQTTADQVRRVLSGFSEALRAQPKLWQGGTIVQLTKIAESSLEIEVAAWFETDDDGFATIREAVLLRFLEIIEAAGTRLAYPTRTIELQPPNAPEKT